MKNNVTIAIFTLTIVTNNLCMQDEYLQELITRKTPDSYKQLESALKKRITTQDNMVYNTTTPAVQYDMLKTCIAENNLSSLKICLKCHFNPNRYRKQISLLHYAVAQQRPEAITILSKYNPDLVPLNGAGLTPLDWAANLQYHTCHNALERAISKKYNELVIRQKHCGLTKHLLNKKRPCLECLTDLGCQLQSHGLWKNANQKETLQIINNLNKNPYSRESAS